MSDPWEILKLLADATRIRILSLLIQEELSVAELQEVLNMGQSRVSSHLGLLRQGDLVADRKDGKKTFYSWNATQDSKIAQMVESSCRAVASSEQICSDRGSLERILAKRKRKAEQYFDSVAGRLGENYCPGRSWQAIGHFLLLLTPKLRIADLGAGESLISQLLAKRADHVICIDNSVKMVEFGRELAARNELTNLEYRVGDIEAVPIEDNSVDLALLSQALHHAQHPDRAVAEAFRILKPGGRVIILDLLEHHFEKARELYADVWLGFSENYLYQTIKAAGFRSVDVSTVARETKEPNFETILATGVK